MRSGIYAIYYTGVAGSGFGIAIMKDGEIVGADVTGGTYDGEYRIDKAAGGISGEVRMNVPAGTPLVTGKVPQNQPYIFAIPLKLPNDLGEGAPITVQTPSGPVNLAFKMLREVES